MNRPVNIGLALVACALSLAAAEAVLRLDPFQYGKYGLYDEICGFQHLQEDTSYIILSGQPHPFYRMRPGIKIHQGVGLTALNASGFQGDTRSDPGSVNLLFAGDSVAFGFHVGAQETFPERIRTRLDKARIMNTAAVSYNTLDEVAIVKEVLQKGEFRPDVVVLQFGFNDFQGVLHIRKKNGQDLYYEKRVTSVFGPPSGLYKFLLDNSFLFYRANSLVMRIFSGGGRLHPYPDCIPQVRSALAELKDLGRTHGFKEVFLFVPYDIRRWKAKGWRMKEVNSYLSMAEYSLDLSDLSGDASLWVDSYHPNAKGHEIIARRLFEYLVREKLI